MNSLSQIDKEPNIWDWVIQFKAFCLESGEFPFSFDPEQNKPIKTQTKTSFTLGTTTRFAKFHTDKNQITLETTKHLQRQEVEACLPYIKLLYLAYRPSAARPDRPLILAHLAQTLDAKIATNCGNSQWISNKENLVHAHKLRAIADAVCIGGKTLAMDKPQLTVRHVRGESPQIVVISQNNITSSELADTYQDAWFYSTEDSNLTSIFEEIGKRNVKLVFVEGGAKMVSALLQHQLVDILQLHIAPKILGSGRNIEFQEVQTINECLEFSESQFFHVGNEIMFEGTPKYENSLA